jgi:hypothetical protein
MALCDARYFLLGVYAVDLAMQIVLSGSQRVEPYHNAKLNNGSGRGDLGGDLGGGDLGGRGGHSPALMGRETSIALEEHQ